MPVVTGDCMKGKPNFDNRVDTMADPLLTPVTLQEVINHKLRLNRLIRVSNYAHFSSSYSSCIALQGSNYHLALLPYYHLEFTSI